MWLVHKTQKVLNNQITATNYFLKNNFIKVSSATQIEQS